MKLLLSLLFTTHAHAGWFKSWCERKLVADDPYQFETASTDWVIKQFTFMQTRDRWKTLPEQDAGLYAILRRELEIRIQYGNPDECDKILEVLKDALSFDLTCR